MDTKSSVAGGLTLVMCHGRVTFVQMLVESIWNQTVQPMSILVIDIGEDPETKAWLKQLSAESLGVSLETTCIGASIARCWNEALEWAFLDKSRKEALVVDSSVELLPETYEVLKEILTSRELGIITATRVKSMPEFEAKEEYEFRTAHLDFNCFMVSADAWNEVGPFDETYRGSEGAEMERRMIKAGFACGAINLPFAHINREPFDEDEEDLPVYRHNSGDYDCAAD